MTRMVLSRALLTAGLAAGLTMAAGTAAATGSTGAYIGGGLGQMSGGGAFDDDAEHWKLVAGYNVGWLPLLDLGAELAYVNGGKIDGRVGDHSATLEVESFQAMAVAGASFGPLGFYAKTGMADWDAEQRGRGVSRDHSGTDPIYGLGVRAGLFGLSGRLEYEYLDTDGIDALDMVTAGVVYTF
ncbi:outer membrane protein [Halomonas halodenitrificans]|uniref:outer membrane protein n=1 Tax=Halomonas halodenitrificans TaxID=28252 RepID=UPI0005B9143D|nr:outer membrane beta-barrel protein [Halomonas halodenitrificans]